jgi:hypothetical protein
MRRVSLILAVLAIAALCWLNYTGVTEAFGSGPPYYSRTANMDKWVNPLPILIPIDVIASVAVWLLLRRRTPKR